MATIEVQKSVDDVYADVKVLFAGKDITVAFLMASLPHIMKIIETAYTLPGGQKKQIVLAVVDKIVREEAPEELREGLISVLDAVLPTAIDVIVSVDKQQIQIAVQKIKSCFTCC